MKKISSLFIHLISLCILFGSVFMTACSDNKNKHPEDMLRIDVGAEVPTLDPQLQQDTASARIAYDLFAGLVDFDQHNNSIPGMAEKWEISSDEKTVIFHLRSGLKFSDGSPITAHDFVYSWRRLANPETGSGYNYLLKHVLNAREIMNGTMSPDFLGVSALDDDTFIVKLSEPDNDFIQKCTLPNLSVVPQRAIEQYGRHWIDVDKIITSGAYQLKEHIINGYILLEKNPYYYDHGSVKILKVKFFPYDDANTSLASYESGELDITSNNLPADQLNQLKHEYPEELHSVRLEGIYYYDFNLTQPELKNNKKLRQALSMAIDREILTKKLLQSSPKPLYSVVSPTIDAGHYANIQYAWAAYPRERQIAEAKKLYQEAGYDQNHPLKISISFNTNATHQKLALAIASMWKKLLGVQTNIKNQEWKTFIDTRKHGNFMIARDGWIADYDSVSTYLVLYQCRGLQNNSHYCNSNYDHNVHMGNIALNAEEQKKYYRKAIEIALNDYAIIPVYQYNYQLLVKPYVKNYDINHNYLDHVQSKWMHF